MIPSRAVARHARTPNRTIALLPWTFMPLLRAGRPASAGRLLSVGEHLLWCRRSSGPSLSAERLQRCRLRKDDRAPFREYRDIMAAVRFPRSWRDWAVPAGLLVWGQYECW